MIAWLIAMLLLSPLHAPAEQVTTYYAEKNAEALSALCVEAPTHEIQLLCTYRLYPLTEDESLLTDLPYTLDNGSAREYALLSGLWGYRAAEANMLHAVRYGRHAQRMLNMAMEANPADPLVMLIEAQSLLFMPSIAGGDKKTSLQRFQALQKLLARDPSTYVPKMEADIWVWYVKQEMNHAGAEQMKARLLSEEPPPLFREFLTTAAS